MMDPRVITKGSIMPAYPSLFEQSIDPEGVQDSMEVLQMLGTPYTDEQITQAPASLQTQGETIVASLAKSQRTAKADDEIVALIAYLQRLGKDGRAALKGQMAAAEVSP